MSDIRPVAPIAPITTVGPREEHERNNKEQRGSARRKPAAKQSTEDTRQELGQHIDELA
ncbi:MAG: hypothetical protein K0U93_16030 [Gammaproteobacteria bacterium]|nr:hypothetical protein [Gammaproteobacteria bacterium]